MFHVQMLHVMCHALDVMCHVSHIIFFIIFTESAHWKDLVSKLQCLCVCVCVCLRHFVVFLLTSYYSHLQRWKFHSTDCKKIHQDKIKKGFWSQMLKLFLKNGEKSMRGICLDTQQNLHGSTTEVAWTNSLIGLDI